MMRVAGFCFIAVVVLSACDPTWGVIVQVTTVPGEPVEGAVVAITECEGAESSATKTDATGSVSLAGPGDGPRPCLVTVAKPGYRTKQTALTDACGEALAACGPHVELNVVLEQLP